MNAVQDGCVDRDLGACVADETVTRQLVAEQTQNIDLTIDVPLEKWKITTDIPSKLMIRGSRRLTEQTEIRATLWPDELGPSRLITLNTYQWRKELANNIDALMAVAPDLILAELRKVIPILEAMTKTGE